MKGIKKIIFTEKPKQKLFSMITGALFIIILLYFTNVLNHNPFQSFSDLVFTILLIVLGISNYTATSILEDSSFFNSGDKMKRYIIWNAAILLIFIIGFVIIYLIFQTLK